LDETLTRYPDIKAVVITSPSYEGLIMDIATISDIVHKHNKILIVDEAHGAHLSFYEFTPKSALTHGADLVIQSLHKTLPALTQTALLHVNSDRIDTELIDFYYQMYQTSSPSFVLVASIDSCISYMASRSLAKQLAYKEMLFNFRKQMNKLEHISLLDENQLAIMDGQSPMHVKSLDPTKLIFMGKQYPLDGKMLDEALQIRFKIVFEMSSHRYLVGISSIADTLDGFALLYDSLELIGKQYCQKDDGKSDCQMEPDFGIIELVEKVMNPSEVMEFSHVKVDLEASVGRIVADYIKIYPPSIPILVPGERISQGIIDYIKQHDGFVIHGIQENKLKVIQ